MPLADLVVAREIDVHTFREIERSAERPAT